MAGFPIEIWSIILSLAGPQTAACFLLVCKRAHSLALRPLLRSVDLNKDSRQTVSFCNYFLSSKGLPNLPLLRHLTVRMQSFYPPRLTAAQPSCAIHQRRARAHERCTSSSALELFRQLLDKLVHMKSLRTIHLDDVPNDVVDMPVFDAESPLSACLKTASFCIQIPSQFRLNNVTTLSLRVLPHSLAHALRASVVFPHLVSLCSTLDVFDIFSHHHLLEHIVIRDHLFHRCRPKWISSSADIEKLFSATKRVPAKSLSLGLTFAGKSPEMQYFFDSLVDVAPGIESLALTMRGTRPSEYHVCHQLHVIILV